MLGTVASVGKLGLFRYFTFFLARYAYRTCARTSDISKVIITAPRVRLHWRS